MSRKALLPVHGFVLAGGQSSRMGRDKATLRFQGRPMVERAVEKLSSFCAEVGIAGNRPDLATVAPVVMETRTVAGPVAGLEAGLQASMCDWALFVPVDVPLMPEVLLRQWTVIVLERGRAGLRLSILSTNGVHQPAFCLLHRACLPALTRAIDEGLRKLGQVYKVIAADLGGEAPWVAEAATFLNEGQSGSLMESFSNVNTPEELALLERRASTRVRA